ncbi:methyl-accepting chemotaxis protein [Brevundimonas sp. TWP2-3-4b1]|uniref:methyl-accepting chemotaxis protein n=1 Tax=Brevundimonas sp. TWP2-3-4b1 TaxID=2804580 RepID=UPI003CEBDCC5
MKLTIKARLLICLGALAVGMVAIGVSGWVSASIMDRRMQSIISDRVVPMQQLKAAVDMYAVNIVDTAQKARAGSVTPTQALASITSAKSTIAENWDAYRSTEMTPAEQELVDQATAALPAADAAVARLEALLRSGDTAGLSAFIDTQLYAAIDPISAHVGHLVDLQVQVAREDGAAAARAFEISLIVMGVIALFAVGLLAFATRVVLHRVSAPLQAMTAAMRRLADGDNGITVPAVGQSDELGEMADAVVVFRDAAIAKIAADADLVEAKARADRVSDGLPVEYAKLQDDFNAAMVALKDTMSVVMTNVSAIRSGASEIAQASDDLSRRTEQQAASLEETAAALDEITATVNRTASGARQASDTVQAAKGDAETSGNVVRDAVGAMGAIEKSAQEISQIIGVIDEIAFQTNLLALNAGVEAARAGDAGRGFAVVASEVRALAQRSAEAAKEIKVLISASTSQVNAGVALVGQTGEALQRIVSRVAEIDGLVSEIAASAQEQATGLQQVNTAVNQMDQVTQQNAAMVEESTAASHSLSQEAATLANSVSRFQIGAVAEAPAARSAPRPQSRPANRPVAQMRTVGSGGAARKPQPVASEDGWEEF